MQNKLTQMALFWFGTIMAAAFLCCGFLFLLSNFLIERVPLPNRTYLGIVMLFYAGFRGTRQYKMYQRIKRGDDAQ
jgi:DMSO/TMAO reductase YedYZ heme-binding membrane subunit